MDIRMIMKTARSVTFALNDGGIYETAEVYRLFLNGSEVKKADTVIYKPLRAEAGYRIFA